MAINLNVSPYYDDFDANKKFNRVVFKPGVAVQARELTQMQDYFYETIKDFADYMFVDGAAVRGASAEPNTIDFIKVNDIDSGGLTVSNDTLANYTGDIVTGGTTGIVADIIGVKTGTQSDAVAKKVLYLQYKKGNAPDASGNLSGDGLNKRFDAGETLTVTSSNSDRNGDTFIVNSDTSLTLAANNFYGQIIDFTIPEGVIYAQGRFVKHETQTIRLDEYTARVNYFVGVILKEEIITSDDDATLLDPATGAFNYNAPGADRTRIVTEIAKVPFAKEYAQSTAYQLGDSVSFDNNVYTVTTAGTSPSSGGEPVHTSGSVTSGSVEFTYFQFPDNFTAVYKVVNGMLQKKINEDVSKLAELGKVLAKRTMEESGNYVIEPFTLEIIEHLKTVKGTQFNTSTNTAYGLRELVNHSGNLYEVTKAGTATAASPPVHTGGTTVISGTVSFTHRGASYRIDNEGYKYSNDPSDPGSADHVVAKVAPGIAYVEGYRREFIENTFVKIRKGTSTKIEEGLDVNLGYGNYVDVDEVVGEWDLENGSLVEIAYNGSLGSQTGSAAATGAGSGTSAPANVIGTARVRQVQWLSGTPGAAACQYRVFLYDIKINTGDFEDATVIHHSAGATNSAFADIILEGGATHAAGGKAKLRAVAQNRMVFPCPWRATKTLYAAGGGTLDTAYLYREEFNVSSLADGTFSLNLAGLGSEFTFPVGSGALQSQCDAAFYVVNNGSAVTINSVSVAAGKVIRITPSMILGTSTTTQLNFDLGTVSGAVDLYVQAKVKVTDAPPVTKNLNQGRYVKIRTVDAANGANGPWSLGIPDVKEIESVYIAPGDRQDGYLDDSDDPQDYKDQFTLDNGQRDNLYGHAQLIKKGSSSQDLTDKLLTIKLKHYVPDYSSSNGTYFAKNSYPVDDTGATGIYTFEIPIYRSQLLGSIDLRDAIDFRPYAKSVAASASTLAAATENPYRTDKLDTPSGGVHFPIPSASFTTDVEYYLPRTDRLYIGRNGNLRIVEGVSDIPSKPPVLKQGMQVAEIRIPPFPSVAKKVGQKFGRIESAVTFFLKGQDKRYTMRDIGAIEKRIDRLEYYLALSLMEMQAKDKVILDANGNDRFKNGIYVNPFDSDLLSDIADPSYNAAYHSTHKLCEPNYIESEISMQINPDHDSSGWARMGQHITRPYQKIDVFENRFATKTRNLVGELLFNFTGKMDLFPRSDNFPDDVTPLQPMNLTASNQADIQAVAASVNASQNVVGSTTTFEMGAVNSAGQFVAGGVNTNTQKVEFTPAEGSDGSFSATGHGQVVGGLPETMTTPRPGGGWFEEIKEGSTTVSASGEVVVSGSYDQTVTSQDIMSSTTEYLLTASAQSAGSLNFNIGNVVRDVSLLPFMRSKMIGVRCSMLKPNTRMYVFFDDQEVTDRCTPCNTDTGTTFDSLIPTFVANQQSGGWNFAGAAKGASMTQHIGNLTTDANGDLAFMYFLEGGRHPVGTRRIFVVDDPTNRDNFITTSAESQYSAFGLHTTTQEVSLTAELYTVQYGTTTGNTSTGKVGSVVTDVVNSNAEISVDVKDFEVGIDITQPEYIFHPPPRFGDPVAQSFTVSASPTEVFLSEIKVWFRSRPGQRDNLTNSATDPSTTGTGRSVEMQIRLCNEAGMPTRTIVGSCTLPHDQIKTTPDLSGGQATNFDYRDQFSTTFQFGQASSNAVGGAESGSPVVLDPAKEYAFVLIPANNDPSYEIWCSKLGEVKIGTQADRVTAEDAYHGMLFTSSNNRTWTPHQQEDMKFVLSAWDFPVGTGTVEVVNEHQEFITGKDYVGGKGDATKPGEWFSFKPTITTAGSGYVVGERITLNTSRANCPKGMILEVTSVNGSGGVTGIKPIQWSDGTQASFEAKPYTLGATTVGGTTTDFTQASTTAVGASFTCNLKPKHMILKKFNPQKDEYDFLLPPTSNVLNIANVLAGDTDLLLPKVDDLWFNDIVGRRSFYVATAGNKKKINLSKTNMTVKEFDGADINITRASTKSSGVSARGTTFVNLTPTLFRGMPEEHAIYSLSEELGFTGSDIMSKKSYRHRIALTNTDPNVSPILNPSRLSANVRSYVINNDSTNETKPLGGNAKSRFISKIVKLADGQEAEDLRLSLAQFTPISSAIKVYFKGLHESDDSDIRREKDWVEMEFADVNPQGASESTNQFIDLDFKLPSTSLNASGQFAYTTRRIDAVTITSAGAGYPLLSDAPIFVSTADGNGAEIEATALNGSGGITAVEIVNPGRGFDSTPPTITVGVTHGVSREYGINQVVANAGKIYRTTTSGTTGAASASSAPTHTSGTVADGTCNWTHLGNQATMTCTVASVEYTGFKYFQCKVVFLSSNTSVIPRIKQLRMIALQA